jgi:SOS-response transcriptional repressor LexA
VAAIVNGMAVIKKYARTKNAVVLIPMSENPEYSQIIMKEDFDQIIGKVIDIIKNPKNEEIVYIPV